MQNGDELIIKKHALVRYYQRVISGLKLNTSSEALIRKSWKNATYVKSVLDHKGEFWKVTDPYPCTFVIVQPKIVGGKPVLVTVLWPEYGIKTNESNLLDDSLDLDIETMKADLSDLKIFSEGLLPGLKYTLEHVHNGDDIQKITNLFKVAKQLLTLEIDLTTKAICYAKHVKELKLSPADNTKQKAEYLLSLVEFQLSNDLPVPQPILEDIRKLLGKSLDNENKPTEQQNTDETAIEIDSIEI